MSLKSSLKSVFLFDAMLVPEIITFVYWIMLVLDIAVGIYLLVTAQNGGLGEQLDGLGVGLAYLGGDKGLQVVIGLAILILGPICWRIWAEWLIVVFKIHGYLRRIADAQAPRMPTESGMTREEIRRLSAPIEPAQ
ncbi:MAG: DUF4282 domain-containing protein [Gammaproteobacteria bacterium]|nr:DUF4282 domain-containing protein [Gammaproteobacteria bacterium]